MIKKTTIAVKIKTYIKNGRQEVSTKEELEKYPVGSLIAYVQKDGVLRTGGFLTGFETDYFIYMKPDFSDKRYRGRYKLISKCFVASVYSTHNDIVSITTPLNGKKSSFPVKINGIVVYYGQKTYDVNRYKATERYQRMIKWCEYFENK